MCLCSTAAWNAERGESLSLEHVHQREWMRKRESVYVCVRERERWSSLFKQKPRSQLEKNFSNYFKQNVNSRLHIHFYLWESRLMIENGPLSMVQVIPLMSIRSVISWASAQRPRPEVWNWGHYLNQPKPDKSLFASFKALNTAERKCII